MLRGRHVRRRPKEGRYEHSRDGRMLDEGDMPLQSISQGPSRVFILAKGAVPPEDEQDGHNRAAGCQNQALHQRQGEEEASQAMLTGDSPSTHPARETRVLRRHGGGWAERGRTL
jgi:hypothetical protein